MTPQQAAHLSGVSRWTIMRAINSQQLKAHRNNRNRWQIAHADLAAHFPHSVRLVQDAQPDESQELRQQLAIETARATAAEADRDHWRDMAKTLAAQRTFKWPWQQ